VSPSMRQSLWLRSKIRKHMEFSNYLPFMEAITGDKWIIKNGEEQIQLANGSSIVCLPGGSVDAKTIRGLGMDTGRGVVVYEEVEGINEYIVQVLRQSTLGTQSSTLAISTPKGTQGPFWELYKYYTSQIKAGKEGYKVWQVDCWQAAKEGRMTIEEIEKERELLGSPLFEQELLAQFVEPFNRVFRREDVAQCLDSEPRDPDRNKRYVIGIDCGYIHDPACVGIFEVSDNFQELWLRETCGFIDHKVKAQNYRFNNYVGVSSYIAIRNYLIASSKRYSTLAVVIDASNNSALADNLLEDFKLPVIKKIFSRTTKAKMAADLGASIRARKIHIWAGEIERQLNNYACEYNDQGKMVLTTISENDWVDMCMLANSYLAEIGAPLKPFTTLVKSKRENIWAS